MSNKNIGSNLKKLLKGGEGACFPEHFLKVPGNKSPTLRIGKGKPIGQGILGKTYRGSINDNGRRYVAYKEINTSHTASTNGAFEFEFKVAQKLKEFAVPEVYLFKKCPIQRFSFPRRTKPKDILYMELLNGKSFDSWWQTNPSLDAIKSVITQVFDNLYRISEKYPDFRHRDLHGGNVMVDPNALTTQYTWKVDNKTYKRTNTGVTAHIIDFGLSYWSNNIQNPETSRGGYEHAGIFKDRPGSHYYDIHRFLYIIYVKVRNQQNTKEIDIKKFIESIIPKEFLKYNGEYTKSGCLVFPAVFRTFKVNLDGPGFKNFKDILTHPFLTGEEKPNRLSEALKMIPKAKTPPKVTKALPPRNLSKISTVNRKKDMNNMIKKAAAVLAANKAKPALKRAGVAREDPRRKRLINLRRGDFRPKPVPDSPKTPTPVRPKEKFSFIDVKGKKREYVRKPAYDKALAKNNSARRSGVDAPPKRKQTYSFVDIRGKKRDYVRKPAYEKALAKNKANRGQNVRTINNYVNSLTNDERNRLKKKVCRQSQWAMSESMIKNLRKLNISS